MKRFVSDRSNKNFPITLVRPGNSMKEAFSCSEEPPLAGAEFELFDWERRSLSALPAGENRVRGLEACRYPSILVQRK